MLEEEVKIKKSEELKQAIGFQKLKVINVNDDRNRNFDMNPVSWT